MLAGKTRLQKCLFTFQRHGSCTAASLSFFLSVIAFRVIFSVKVGQVVWGEEHSWLCPSSVSLTKEACLGQRRYHGAYGKHVGDRDRATKWLAETPALEASRFRHAEEDISEEVTLTNPRNHLRLAQGKSKWSLFIVPHFYVGTNVCSDFIKEVSLASGNYMLCGMLFSKNIKRDPRYHLFFVRRGAKGTCPCSSSCQSILQWLLMGIQ